MTFSRYHKKEKKKRYPLCLVQSYSVLVSRYSVKITYTDTLSKIAWINKHLVIKISKVFIILPTLN